MNRQAEEEAFHSMVAPGGLQRRGSNVHQDYEPLLNTHSRPPCCTVKAPAAEGHGVSPHCIHNACRCRLTLRLRDKGG